jgi:hypothetical protein
MEGATPPSPSQIEHIASDIEEYKQEDERLLVESEENWQPLEPPGSSISVEEPSIANERR